MLFPLFAQSRHARPLTNRLGELFSTPLMAIEPIIYQRPRQRFRLLALASDDFAGAFNIAGINGYGPFGSFDPGADGIPDAPVFHTDILGPNRKPGNQSYRAPGIRRALPLHVLPDKRESKGCRGCKHEIAQQ